MEGVRSLLCHEFCHKTTLLSIATGQSSGYGASRHTLKIHSLSNPRTDYKRIS